MGRNLRVLIIDDNNDLKSLYDAVKAMLDVDVDFISDGLQALPYLEKNTVDAVLVDLAMPYFDGISCVKEIRNNEKLHVHRSPVKLAFFTAHHIDDVVQAVQAEFNVEKVFQKPCEPFELMERIKKWLGYDATTPIL